jgi:spore coat polysaccharide biosynthesis protein SpsF
MNIAIIQARENSNRLPKKVLLPLVDKTVLEHVYNRVSQVNLIDRIIVATGSSRYNSNIISLCKSNNIEVFSGSDEDVLNRYYKAALSVGAKHGDQILRITADCPLIDPAIIRNTLLEHIQFDVDYSSNNLEDLLPDGMDVEVLTFATLEFIQLESTKKSDREHVTKYIYTNPDKFLIHKFKLNKDYPPLRLTLDEQEDYVLIKEIYHRLYQPGIIFGLDTIMELYFQDKIMFQINEQYSRNDGLRLSLENEAFVQNNLNRICLGTAQLGMNYGLFNTAGKMSSTEFKQVLSICKSEGVYLIDTAFAYGSSETELGQMVDDVKPFQITTKFTKKVHEQTNKYELPEAQLLQSLNRLNRSSVYCYMLHSFEDLKDSILLKSLVKCKQSGKTQHIGVSVYEVQEALDVLQYDVIDVIQIKYNVLDNELSKTNFFERAKEKKKSVFVRSVFLQGVLLANEINLPSRLIELSPRLVELDEIAYQFGLKRIDIALYYVLQNQLIDGVVIGFDSAAQFQEILDSIKRLKPNKMLTEKLSLLSYTVDKKNIDPRTWVK